MRRTTALVFLVTLTLATAACASTAPRHASPTTTRASTESATTSKSTATSTTTDNSPVVSGFVAFGDFGGGSAQGAVAQAMTGWADSHRVDALVTTGDNVYTTGDPAKFAAQLDQPYRVLRATRPMWVTLGNHDEVAGHGAQQLRHLGLPPLPYTEQLPAVQLLFLDANHPDQAQADWLDQRLSDPGPIWRIVVFHQPAYSCGLHGPTAAVDRFWVPVLERHRVALVLNGHDHDYERFTSPAGVTYVVAGGGGQGTYRLLPVCALPVRAEAVQQRHHFVGVEVRPSSLTLTAVEPNGHVLDRAILMRP